MFFSGYLSLAPGIHGASSANRLGSLEVVCWIPGGFSLNPCIRLFWVPGEFCFSALGFLKVVFLDPWWLFLVSLHMALWIIGMLYFSACVLFFVF